MTNDDIRWLSNYIVRTVMVILLTIIAAGTCANNKQLEAIRKAVATQGSAVTGDPR